MKQKIWRCGAGCPDFITITTFPDPPDPSAYLMIEYFSETDSFWNRIKAVFNILRGRRHLWCEITLEDDQALEISEELLEANRSIKNTYTDNSTV